MRNRWFHRPELHCPEPGVERKAGWLELFYDLIFVATLIQLGDALSHDVSVGGFLAFAGLFVPIWSAWTGFTFYTNRFVVDDFLHRALIFAQMFGIGAMAVSVEMVVGGDPRMFAISYGVVRLLLAALYFRTLLQVDGARDLSLRWTLTFVAEAALWIASAFVDPPWTYAMWGLGIAINLSLPVARNARELSAKYPPDVLHMSERYGLFTLIVLGESFVKMLSSLSDAGIAQGSVVMAVCALAVTCSLWWIYFDDVAGSRLKRKPAAVFIWLYGHLPLAMAITAVGVAAKKVLFFEPALAAPAGYRWLLSGALGLALLATGIIDWVTERHQAELSDSTRVTARLASACFVLLLAPVGGYMPAGAFVGMVAAVMVAQVLFDLLTAPEMAHPEELHHAQEHFNRVARPERPARQKRRYDIGDAYRRGTPNELRRDLYFLFMEGSWTRLILFFVGLFLFVNVVFAALYMLEPGSVANVRGDSFADAFFFSVQTISTIGFGGMTPLTTYGHVLVTIEAIVGIIGVALVTGMVFAKASRAHSSVLFSKVAVISRRHGVPTLMIRIGNARGNDVVDAHVSLSVLIEEVSPEGHKLRRLHDLSLSRPNTPIFALTWTVMHEIDETSPLAGIDWSRVDEHLLAMVAIMTGHDSTYAQTTHARHIYDPEDFVPGHRFVDILSDMDDGRLMLDYTKFHDVTADPVDAGGEEE
jgi:low temperature requirement protein LtrA